MKFIRVIKSYKLFEQLPNVEYFDNDIDKALRETTDVNKKYGDAQKTLLHYSIEDWNTNAILQLLEKGADIDAQDRYGRTPLMAAVSINNLEVAEILLKKGANPNLGDINGVTALRMARNSRHPDMIKLLKEFGANRLFV